MMRGDFHFFFQKQILKQESKGVLLTCSKENWTEGGWSSAFWNLVILSSFGEKRQKPANLHIFTFFQTLCFDDRALTLNLLNLHVAHAHAFHLQKFDIDLCWICLGSVLKMCIFCWRTSKMNNQCFILQLSMHRPFIFKKLLQHRSPNKVLVNIFVKFFSFFQCRHVLPRWL